MEKIILEGTSMVPHAIYNGNGVVEITGRAIPDNAANLFDPLKNWVDKYTEKTITLDINIEYLNTSSSMQLYMILQVLDAKEEIEEINVIWHYEEDDEDHYDTGLTYEERLKRVNFSYQREIETAA